MTDVKLVINKTQSAIANSLSGSLDMPVYNVKAKISDGLYSKVTSILGRPRDVKFWANTEYLVVTFTT
jgi:hypothetical protein